MNGNSSESIEIEGLLATTVLDRDKVPNENQSETCFSCNAEMVGLFCKDCGQKNDDYRRSIFSLVTEGFASIFSLDSNIWKTWRALLFQPGRVAREYANGKRTQWSSPVRVYLAMSLLLFGYIALTQTQIISLDINVQSRSERETPADQVTLEDLKMTLGVSMFETQSQIDKRNADRNFDYIQMAFDNDGYDMKFNNGGLIFEKSSKEISTDSDGDVGSDALDSKQENTTPQNDKPEDPSELLNDGLDSLMNGNSEGRYIKINGQNVDVSKTSFREGIIRFMRDPSDFNQTFSKYLPRIMFIMMPFTMFVGALFIRGRGNAFLYDHLVHAAYIHAVVFFLLLLGLLLGRISFLSGSLILICIVIYLFFYLPLSLKHMFRRGIIKTVWTSYAVAWIYVNVMFTVLIYLSVMGMRGYLASP